VPSETRPPEITDKRASALAEDPAISISDHRAVNFQESHSLGLGQECWNHPRNGDDRLATVDWTPPCHGFSHSRTICRKLSAALRLVLGSNAGGQARCRAPQQAPAPAAAAETSTPIIVDPRAHGVKTKLQRARPHDGGQSPERTVLMKSTDQIRHAGQVRSYSVKWMQGGPNTPAFCMADFRSSEVVQDRAFATSATSNRKLGPLIS
jgi:hypothetical protein